MCFSADSFGDLGASPVVASNLQWVVCDPFVRSLKISVINEPRFMGHY